MLWQSSFLIKYMFPLIKIMAAIQNRVKHDWTQWRQYAEEFINSVELWSAFQNNYLTFQAVSLHEHKVMVWVGVALFWAVHVHYNLLSQWLQATAGASGRETTWWQESSLQLRYVPVLTCQNSSSHAVTFAKRSILLLLLFCNRKVDAFYSRRVSITEYRWRYHMSYNLCREV